MSLKMYFTVDERYMKAVDKYNCGMYAKAKILFERLLEEEPDYAKAHFMLGKLYYIDLRDFAKAEQHFNHCIGFEPGFPDVYRMYLKMLVFLAYKEKAEKLAEKALLVPGVCKACIHTQLAELYEQDLQLSRALEHGNQALMKNRECCNESSKRSVERIRSKIKLSSKKQPYKYHIS